MSGIETTIEMVGAAIEAGNGEDRRGAAWPVAPTRRPVQWYPAPQRLISMVRSGNDTFVLPPAMVRKSPWRD